MHKNKFVRYILIFLGSLSLALGVIGIVLPGLPTTPFVLLSALLYARGSQKFYTYLESHKYFGKKIRDYKEKKGLSLFAKFKILIITATMVLFSCLLFVKQPIFIIITCIGATIGTLVVFFWVPTAKKNT